MSRGYASSSSRATVLRLVLAVQVAFDIGLILFQRGLVFAGDSGVRLSTGQIALVRGVLGAIGPVSVVIALVVMVAIFAWLSRVVENIPALTGRTPERSPRASIGWWFVPLASWVVPLTIVRDAAWRLRSTADDAAVRLVLPWWILHVVAAIGGIVFGRGLVDLDAEATVLVAQALLVVEALGDVLLTAVVASVARNERVQAGRLDFSARGGWRWPRFEPLLYPQEAKVAHHDASVEYHPIPLGGRRIVHRADDPLAPQPDESSDDYEARVLAALEAEAIQR